MSGSKQGNGFGRTKRNVYARVLILFLLGVSLCAFSPAANAVTLYWTNAGAIQKADLDGGRPETAVPKVSGAWSVAVDLVNEHIYWSAGANIYRANIDGTNTTLLVSTYPVGNVEVDLTNNHLYWNDDFGIRRSNLDGTNSFKVFEQRAVVSFALDPANSHIYWTQQGDMAGIGGVKRVNMDGTKPVDLVTGIFTLFDIVLDHANGKMYWANHDTGSIQSANLDGSDVTTVIPAASKAKGIALDVANNHIYWAAAGRDAILRGNMIPDLKEPVTVVDSLADPTFLAIDPASANLPPVANAGPDQSIRAGETAFLNGLKSSDDNTDSKNLLYFWAITLVPEGSLATLVGEFTPAPQLLTDLPGTYAVRLFVKDEGGLKNDKADVVLISTDNLAPTALATADSVLVPVGTPVALDGSGSTDPEGDVLTYFWTLVTPVGSAAALDDPGSETPTFTPDIVGAYGAALFVSDLLGEGAPSSVEITAVTAEELATLNIVDASGTVSELSADAVTTGGNQNAFQNFLQQAATAIAAGDTDTAIQKLETAISRTDGCVLRGEPDGNGPGRDWVTNCAAQVELYALLTAALNAITP